MINLHPDVSLIMCGMAVNDPPGPGIVLKLR